MSVNNKIKIKGKIVKYLKWPLYFNIFWIVVALCTYAVNVKAGVIMTIAALVYVVLTVILYLKFKPNIMKYFVDFGAEYSQVQRQMLREMEVPYGLIEETGKVLWTNIEMDNLTQKSMRGKNVMSVFKEFHPEHMEFEDNGRNEFRINYEGGVYKVILRAFTLNEAINESHLAEVEDNSAGLISMYMFDETLIQQLTKENREERLVTGHIYIDNYDEVLQSIKSTRRTLLIALIDRKINKYFSQYDGIVRKLENDKYFVIFKTKYISKMQTNKFSVLDEVKTVNFGNELPITISIGVGMGGNGLIENYELAGTAIDMALGRGGDQAVLKDGNKVYYYGGKSKSVEKNSKVKSRVKATAFRDLIDTKETLYIMGHQIADNDSFGAAIGLYRIAKTIGKPAHIVIGEVGSSVVAMVDEFKENDIYEEDMFLRGPEAAVNITKNDALIVVDCNSVGYTEYPDLVRRASCIIVFDHHRQNSDVIEGAQLSYVELSSSSTCEMVVEVAQYISETVKLTRQEASAVYSGLMVDTNNFTNRTGVRTFEAAAYLRKNGADIEKVHRMFRDDINDYKAKAEAVKDAEIFMEEYAITKSPTKGVSAPTVVGAQVANELLNIKGIKASFVCTQYNDQIYISARSVGKINVQVIMERFGGGGHMNLAGAQVKDRQIDDVVFMLKQTINTLVKEGEL